MIRLLDLDLEQLLDRVLNNLSSFLDPSRERSQRFFELRLHLRGNVLVLLGHGLELAADCVQGSLQRAALLGPQVFLAQVQQLSGVLVFDRGPDCLHHGVSTTSGCVRVGSCVLTAIEVLELIAGLLRIYHSLQKGADASIVFAPEIVGNCIETTVSRLCSRRGLAMH
jgi:hypothetical protein